MQVVIPDVNTINLKRYNALKYLSESDKLDAVTAIKFLSSYLNIDENILHDNQHSNNVELFYTVCESIGKLRAAETPHKEIVVNGKTYVFHEILDANFPSIWYMTVQRYLAQGIEAHHIAAFVYIEKGMKYNQRDESGIKVLNPLDDRIKEFEEHMTAEQYIPLQGFFFRKFNEYKEPFLAIQKARIKTHQLPAKWSEVG